MTLTVSVLYSLKPPLLSFTSSNIAPLASCSIVKTISYRPLFGSLNENSAKASRATIESYNHGTNVESYCLINN